MVFAVVQISGSRSVKRRHSMRFLGAQVILPQQSGFPERFDSFTFVYKSSAVCTATPSRSSDENPRVPMAANNQVNVPEPRLNHSLVGEQSLDVQSLQTLSNIKRLKQFLRNDGGEARRRNAGS